MRYRLTPIVSSVVIALYVFIGNPQDTLTGLLVGPIALWIIWGFLVTSPDLDERNREADTWTRIDANEKREAEINNQIVTIYQNALDGASQRQREQEQTIRLLQITIVEQERVIKQQDLLIEEDQIIFSRHNCVPLGYVILQGQEDYPTAEDQATINHSKLIMQKQQQYIAEQEKIIQQQGQIIQIQQKLLRQQRVQIRANLVLLSNGQVFPLKGELILVGRGDPHLNIYPEILLTDKTVGRRHAYLRNRQGIYTIEDLDTLNKTFLNGVMLMPNEEQMLKDGDILLFASVEARFELSQPKPPLAIF